MFKELKQVRNNNRKRPIIAYININSVRYKFHELREILDEELVDILTIAETKLDNSFNNNLFTIDGCKLERRDRTAHECGIMTLVRADLPIRMRKDLECDFIESL